MNAGMAAVPSSLQENYVRPDCANVLKPKSIFSGPEIVAYQLSHSNER